jgi:hypothetical protein
MKKQDKIESSRQRLMEQVLADPELRRLYNRHKEMHKKKLILKVLEMEE